MRPDQVSELEKPPLEGVKVLDLTRVMAGPFATMILGDYGADVLKIEDVEVGDETRRWVPPRIDGESAYFMSVNRNKRSLALNLKSEEGVEIFYRLVKEADVVIENFRPGVASRLRIDYETLSRINPRIIYCSISGFGQTGPYRDLPGYDLVVFAMGGIMSFTGEPGRPPVRVNVPIADMAAGMMAVSAILAALLHRARTGEGQYIDISLHDVQVFLLTHQAMNYVATGRDPERTGSMHPNIAPYQAFRASDGYFVIAVGNDRQWRDLCAALGRPELGEDERFKTNEQRVRNRSELLEILEPTFAEKPVMYWVELARRAGVPAGPILRVSEVLEDEHVKARGMVMDVYVPRLGKNVKQLGPAPKLSKTPPSIRLPPPAHGEHTVEVLRSIGYSDEQIEELSKRGVIRTYTR